MLAAFLRRLFFWQTLGYAVIGVWLVGVWQWQVLWVLAAWLALPLLMVSVWTAKLTLRSRPQGAVGWVWWRAIAGESWAIYRLLMGSMPWVWSASQLRTPTAPSTKVPVLLIHGYCCNYGVWHDVAPRLQALGHTVLAINLEPLFCSIDDYAPQVEQALAQLRAQTGEQRVALVGHSMGGLVIRAWMRVYGDTQVAVAVTLGSPHQGTQITPHAKLPNARQMVWASDWLQALQASESPQRRALLRIALTEQDAIVFPQTRQTLPGVDTQVFSGIGHLQLCTDARVFAWLAAELNRTEHQKSLR
jgi:triacylglycerol esterase/lipase EstA (alpha/beta hydrolase family)